jgi:Mg2+-importing ATPase
MKEKNTDLLNKPAEKAGDRLLDSAVCDAESLLARLNGGSEGLSDGAAAANRERFGANDTARKSRASVWRRLFGAFVNPFTAVDRKSVV